MDFIVSSTEKTNPKRLIGSIGATTFGLMFASSVMAAEVEWDLPVQWPESNFMTDVIRQYAEEVEARSDGEIVFNVQSGGALGITGPELMGAIRSGVFNIGEFSLAQAVGEVPIFGLERVPGLYENYEAFAVFQAVAEPYFQKELKDNNQLMLFNVPWPWTHIHTSKPIGTLSDLEGLKIRTFDPFGTSFYQKLGASPIQMPWAEVVPALASGAIDGVHTSASSAADGKFWEFMKGTELLGPQTSTSGLFINLDALHGLSPEHQDIILSTAEDMTVDFWLRSRADEDQKIQELTENGMYVEQAPDDVKARAEQASLEIAQEFVSQTPEAAEIVEKYFALRGRETQ